MRRSRLAPTKRKACRKKIFGFDIETYGRKNEFLCATVYEDDDHIYFFKDRQELIRFFDTHKFRNSFVAATNLSFDFFGTFRQYDEQKEYMTLFRGSDLLYAKKEIHKREYLTFIDTFNYCKMSVEKMGDIIKVPKLEKPSFLGERPKNPRQWQIMKEYNIQDAKVSKLFLEFLFDGFYKLGATPKMTIASTAMSLFRNKYLDAVYYNHPEDITEEQFEGYYGGRTEAFKRGLIVNHKYYDVNSLYPFVMRKHHYPDPNSIRCSESDSLEYVHKYEGMAKVDVLVPPDIRHPLLCIRTKDKLLFPTGTFTSWQTNSEIRKALSIGYKILKVHKTYYYKRNCRPFKGYVDDIYNLKKQYTRDKDPMVVVVKLLLNSLYGKFGQKFMERENYVPESKVTQEMLDNALEAERIEGFFRLKQRTRMPSFCFPIWALHISSYARMHLYDLIVESDPAYTDTDSIMTEKEMPTGEELGELKLEMNISRGVIVRPKFYGLVDDNGNDYIKVKGVGCKLNRTKFTAILEGEPIVYDKFMKFKESLKRGFIPGEIQQVTKVLSCNDTKREWTREFSPFSLDISSPVHLKDGKTVEEIKKENMLTKKLIMAQERRERQEYFDSDLFDKESVGEDIGYDEFLDNEVFFALHE